MQIGNFFAPGRLLLLPGGGRKRANLISPSDRPTDWGVP